MNLKLIPLTLLVSFINLIPANSQTPQINCKTQEANDEVFKKEPDALKEYNAFNKFSKEFAKSRAAKSRSNNTTYIIPVVFHVYGRTHNGRSITYQKIVNSLNQVNEEFNGLNDDFNTVSANFNAIKSTLNIQFRLAKIDPNGKQTNGVTFHPAASGHGDKNPGPEVRRDAWNNYKYMNVYLTNDLYGDGVTNRSGVAWYPNTFMSDANTARVVYNGAYLTGNTSKEFASVLTHEFGHWLNLIHTHEGGCSGTDLVDDTPQDTQSNDGNCSETFDCGKNINHENYMGYNGAAGCYKMFTKGQTDRMLAALQHPARVTLWQPQNLIDTGVQSTLSADDTDTANNLNVNAYPNPTNDVFNISTGNLKNENINISIYNTLGQKVFKKKFSNAKATITIAKALKTSGYYIVKLQTDKGIHTSLRIIKN